MPKNANNNNNGKSCAIILVCAFMFLCANNRNFNILTVMRMSKIYVDVHKKQHSVAFELTLLATPAAWVLMGRGWVAGRQVVQPRASRRAQLLSLLCRCSERVDDSRAAGHRLSEALRRAGVAENSLPPSDIASHHQPAWAWNMRYLQLSRLRNN